jgi:hypothetical protein
MMAHTNEGRMVLVSPSHAHRSEMTLKTTHWRSYAIGVSWLSLSLLKL